MTYALIAAGGTGGHVYPALALADILVARGHPRDSIRFVGARRGLERRVVPEAGFGIDCYPGRGLERRLSWRNLLAVVELALAVPRALALQLRLKPRVVVGFGGYASFPVLLVAALSRRPALVHEQNAAAGLTNRIVTRLGARAAVSLPDSGLAHAVETGNPVRPALARVQRSERQPPLVAVVSGSLGAATVNDAALELYTRWRERNDVVVRHITGVRDYETCQKRLDERMRPGDLLRYDLVEYQDDMAELYAQAAVVVGRAGASTIAELAAIGVPSVLVPLPGAPGDHQHANAAQLAKVGGAVVLEDSECDGETLAAVLEPIVSDSACRRDMAAGARRLGRPDAGERLADLVEELAGG